MRVTLHEGYTYFYNPLHFGAKLLHICKVYISIFQWKLSKKG